MYMYTYSRVVPCLLSDDHWSDVKNLSHVLSLELMKNYARADTDMNFNKHAEKSTTSLKCKVHKFLSEKGIVWLILYFNGTKTNPDTSNFKHLFLFILFRHQSKEVNITDDILRIKDYENEESDAVIVEQLTLPSMTYGGISKVFCIVTPNDSNYSLNASVKIQEDDSSMSSKPIIT